MRGPNPMNSSVTFMPVHRAAMKCPISCRNTITTRAQTTTTQLHPANQPSAISPASKPTGPSQPWRFSSGGRAGLLASEASRRGGSWLLSLVMRLSG